MSCIRVCCRKTINDCSNGRDLIARNCGRENLIDQALFPKRPGFCVKSARTSLLTVFDKVLSEDRFNIFKSVVTRYNKLKISKISKKELITSAERLMFQMFQILIRDAATDLRVRDNMKIYRTGTRWIGVSNRGKRTGKILAVYQAARLAKGVAKNVMEQALHQVQAGGNVFFKTPGKHTKASLDEFISNIYRNFNIGFFE